VALGEKWQRRQTEEGFLMAAERVVRWQGTDESWREIVDLHDGLETVALWPPGQPLSVETAKGREPVPLQSRGVRGENGVIRIESV
jgi:hypothetical protein